MFMLLNSVQEYIPVVLVHGIMDNYKTFDYVVEQIQQMYPGIYTVSLQPGEDLESIFQDINKMVDNMQTQIDNDPNLQKGFQLMCHSQGSMLCRAWVEKYNTQQRPVYNLILLSGPNQGFYCGIESECPVIGQIPRLIELADSIVYTPLIQEVVAPAGYWNSPYEQEEYLKGCQFLPVINNDVTFNQTYKDNFIAIEKLILVGGSSDGVIMPWQSAFFGYWVNGTDSEIVLMEDTREYKEDLFGLKTLVESGKVDQYETNYQHNDYLREEGSDFMNNIIYPYFNEKFE